MKLIAVIAVIAALVVSQAKAATVNQVTVTQDLGAGTAAFHISWNSAPDFFTFNAGNNAPADSFQFYIDGQPPFSPGAVSLIRGDEIRFSNNIVIRNFSGVDPDPHAGGWGTVRGTVPYTLTGNDLDFVVPLLMLGTADHYASMYWEIYNFGSTVLAAPTSVPLPGALWLFGGGLIGLIALGRKRMILTARE